MRHRIFLCTLMLFTLCLWSSGIARAQSATASLSGTVEDEKGAVITGASVLAINLNTDARRFTKTGADGGFAIPLLPPSTYLLRVERAGFAPAEVRGVVLNVNDQAALRIQLKVGRVVETVEVTEDASLVDKSPAVGTVVNRQFVANLPLNGRSFNALINLTPGVVTTPSSFLEPGQFSVNGQRPDANYFTVDGVSANIGISAIPNLVQTASGSIPATSALGGTNNLVSVDALQEFRIQTSSYAPEFGRSPGAQVQLVTRSGSNDFHATLFEYFGHGALGANDYFANRRRLPKPANRLDDFGGVLGGPVIKNKTFIFSSFEGLRLQQPRVGVTTVPSLATRRSAAPALRPVLAAFPLPNGEEVENGLAEFSAGFSNPSSLDAISLRVDHSPSAKLTLFIRYNQSPSENVSRGVSTSLSTVSTFRVTTQTLTSGGTWAISANHSHEFRFNYSLTGGRSSFTVDDFGGAFAPRESLFFPAPLSGKDGLVIVQFLDSAVLGLGNNVNNRQRQLNIVDNHSLVRAVHLMKFGVDYRQLAPTLGARAYDQFALFNDLDAVRNGIASVVSIGAQEKVALFFTNFSAYGQDTWKLGQRLTLTYGLRWDVNPAPSGKAGREPFAVTGFDDFATLALAPRGTALYETTYRNFAPRIGLAYQLSQKRGRETVLRGGFGIFYDLGTSSAGTLTASGVFPYGATRFLASVAYPVNSSLAAPPSVSDLPPVSQATIFDPHLELPRVYQWNFAVAQSLGAQRAVSASYVAAVGRRLLQLGFATTLNPTFPGATTFISNGPTSDYHALQLQFGQRLSAGLQTLVSYTWSHSIDTASTDIGATNIRQLDLRINRGSSDFDIRHTVNAALTWNLPVPALGKLGYALLRDWVVDTISSARSAFPVNVIARNAGAISGQFLLGGFRPDLIPSVPLYVNDRSVAGGRRINRAAFAVPPASPLRQGTLGRNVLRGFPFFQTDLALRREFKVTETVKLQFRSEFFNLFNHPNFENPINQLGNSLFGQSTQTLGRSLGTGGEGGFSPLYQTGGPRSIQFAFKLLF